MAGGREDVCVSVVLSVVCLFVSFACFSTHTPHAVVSVGQGNSWQSDF